MRKLILPRRKLLIAAGASLITSPAVIRRAMAQVPMTGAGRTGAAVTPVSVDQFANFPAGAIATNIDVTMSVNSGATLLLAMVVVRGIQSSISGGTCSWDPAGVSETLTLIGSIVNTNGGSAGGSTQSIALYGRVNPTAGASKVLRITTTNTFVTTIAGASFFNTKTVLANAVTGFTPTSITTGLVSSITGSLTAAANNIGITLEHCDNTFSSQSSISGTYPGGNGSNSSMRCGYGIGAAGALVTQTLTGKDGGGAPIAGDNYASIVAEIVAGP